MSYLKAHEPECDSKHCPEDVDMLIIPRVVDLGGFEVRRVLPASKKTMVGPFIFWDQFGPTMFDPGKGIDVRPHPHIGLSTLTYLLEGSLSHRDTLGNHQIIQPGDVNLMTAGKGIAHSERTPADDRKYKHPVYGIQCWMALPKVKEEMEPAFKHYAGNTLPYVNDDRLKIRVVTGNYQGLKSPVMTVSDTLFIDCIMSPEAVLNIPAEAEERAIYLLDNGVIVDGKPFEKGDMLVLKPGHEVDVESTQHTHLIILGGAPLDGSRHIWWNFVSSSSERIKQAGIDWQEGKFGKIPGDDKEYIPLPE